MIQSSCQAIFTLISQSVDSNYTVDVSVIEVYNEEVRDLLIERGRMKELIIQENRKSCVFVNASKSAFN